MGEEYGLTCGLVGWEDLLGGPDRLRRSWDVIERDKDSWKASTFDARDAPGTVPSRRYKLTK